MTKPTKNYQKLTPEKAYILGVLCGDGYIGNGKVHLEIRKDVEFIEEFLRCIEAVYGLKYHYKYYKKRNSLKSYITSRIICNDLLKYGKFGTKDWKVPKLILKSDIIPVKTNFLRGVYDSEGYVGKDRISFCSSSVDAIKTTSQLLDQLEIKHRIYKHREYTILGIYRKNDRLIFKELIGFTIKRKIERLRW